MIVIKMKEEATVIVVFFLYLTRSEMYLRVKRKRLIFLHHISNVSRNLIRKMLLIDPTLTFVFTSSPYELSRRLHISLKKATYIYERIHDAKQLRLFENNLKNIHVITIFDDDYPQSLKHIYDPPYVLYCLGNIKLLKEKPLISVIGTRTPSTMGPKKVHFIVSPLIHKNWTIVSGLAYGIDRYAHELALKYNGNTIAILGSGFHHIYPQEHKTLFLNIVERGLVLTEYPPHVKPKRHHFPERNRIISGLSDATLVIEAKEKSGTYITVDYALEQGKEVYVVPGSILCPQTKGCHKMIQEGAKLVMTANDILEDFQ